MPGYELIGKEEKEAVDDVFEKGGVLSRYGLDAKRQKIFRVDDFEKEVCRKIGAKYCHCVSSGTSALISSLFALGLRPGDEVITQSFTFVATVEAILTLGGIPIVAEIDKSLNMDPGDLEKKITDKTKIIIPVHMLGVPAKMDEIMAIAKKHNLAVLEDAAQAFGASYKGKCLGTIGDAGIFSFDIGKPLTMGEGGAVVTNRKDVYLKVREYSDHGHECNPAVPRGQDTRSIWGQSYRMSEIQGAIGLAQIKKFDYVLEKQKENKKKIKDSIKDIADIEFRELPDEKGEGGDTLIFFAENKDKAKLYADSLKAEGFGTKNLPDAIDWHFSGTWNHIFSDCSVWPKSENLLRKAIAIPIYVNMEENQINKLIKAIRDVS
jgi:8-amino-3,8-dideoxy-alpha-D-manno-octulosonate transaminase